MSDNDQGMGREVLLAVDDSDASEAAVKWAVQEFYKPGDTFHLTHVINESSAIDPYYSEQKLTEQAIDMCEKRFIPIVVTAEVPFKVDIIRKASDGEPIGEAIVRYAHHLKTPAIIMAKHTQGLKKFFMGSVAKYVSEHAQEPVVVLK
eukprot:jgi/Botrbrau1/17939/Bobra.50_1s0035.1